MRKTLSLSLVTLAAALTACTAEKPAPEPAPPEAATAEAGDPAAGEGPAGEVPAGTREPSEAPGGEAAKAELPEGVDAKWALYYEHGLAFEFGSEAGLAKAAETGKPMMMFYTATW